MFDNVKAELGAVRDLAIQVREEVVRVETQAATDLGKIDDYFGQTKLSAEELSGRIDEVVAGAEEKVAGLAQKLTEAANQVVEQLDVSKIGAQLDAKFDELTESLSGVSSPGPITGGDTSFLSPGGGD